MVYRVCASQMQNDAKHHQGEKNPTVDVNELHECVARAKLKSDVVQQRHLAKSRRVFSPVMDKEKAENHASKVGKMGHIVAR